MRCYDINFVDGHICATDPSQKVLDSWVRIKKDAAEALNPSHNSIKPKMPSLLECKARAECEVSPGYGVTSAFYDGVEALYKYIARHFGH